VREEAERVFALGTQRLAIDLDEPSIAGSRCETQFAQSCSLDGPWWPCGGDRQGSLERPSSLLGLAVAPEDLPLTHRTSRTLHLPRVNTVFSKY